MKLAIIPARGGSKRIPQKNIRPFCGQPMIGYSIQVAYQSGLFDRVVVSTDCPEIAEVAQSFEAEVPFFRPADLSHDRAATMPVIRHAINFAESNWTKLEAVCCIYATAPFLLADDLQQGLQLLSADEQTEFVFSVTAFASPILRALKLVDGQTHMMWPEHQLTRSQDLPEAYHDAAQFYWGRPDAFLKYEHLYSGRSAAVIVPRYRAVDIDTPEDWQHAEALYSAQNFNRPNIHVRRQAI